MSRWLFILLAFAAVLTGGAAIAPKLIAAWRQNEPPKEKLPPPPVKASINGVRLVVPQDLIRFDNQKVNAELPRLDLLVQWPGLQGRGTVDSKPASLANLIFLSITPKDESLSPVQRLGGIYNKFLSTDIRSGPGGLAVRSFLPESGYDGEELLYDAARPGQFFLRCAPAAGSAPASCLREMRLDDKLDVVYRVARPQLDEWKNIDMAMLALLSAIGAPDTMPAPPAQPQQ